MNYEKIAEFEKMFLSLSEAQQDAFFEAIKDILDEKEYKTIVIHLGALRMLKNEAKYKAIRTALGEQLYKEFNEE